MEENRKWDDLVMEKREMWSELEAEQPCENGWTFIDDIVTL